MAEAVEAAGGELAAAGVERQLAIEADTLTAFDEGSGLAGSAELQRFQPHQHMNRKAVVELLGYDVGLLQIGT